MTKNKIDDQDLPPGIEEYLEAQGNTAPVYIPELDDIVDIVVAKTGLNLELATIIVQSIFQEIRNSMLRGEAVAIRGLGEFMISSPKRGNKKRVFPKFRPYKSLTRKLNE